jgi:DNA-directed RNA polymerase alpha subunit
VNEKKDGRMTRLRQGARNQGIAFEAFIRQPEADLMRIPNLGRKSVALAKALSAASALSFWAAE